MTMFMGMPVPGTPEMHKVIRVRWEKSVTRCLAGCFLAHFTDDTYLSFEGRLSNMCTLHPINPGDGYYERAGRYNHVYEYAREKDSINNRWRDTYRPLTYEEVEVDEETYRKVITSQHGIEMIPPTLMQAPMSDKKNQWCFFIASTVFILLFFGMLTH
jgi:hypothetical protein